MSGIVIPNFGRGSGPVNQWSRPAFFAGPSGAQSPLPCANVYTKIALGYLDYDTDNCFDHVTYYRFTPNVPGWYYVYAAWGANLGASNRLLIQIYKNGSVAGNRARGSTINGGTYVNEDQAFIQYAVLMNGIDDYLELWYRLEPVGASRYGISNDGTYMGAWRIENFVPAIS